MSYEIERSNRTVSMSKKFLDLYEIKMDFIKISRLAHPDLRNKNKKVNNCPAPGIQLIVHCRGLTNRSGVGSFRALFWFESIGGKSIMMKSLKIGPVGNLIGLFLVLVTLSTSCGPAPRRLLSQDEKSADLLWFLSMIEENYAPLQYKQERFEFDWEARKVDVVHKTQAAKTNEEFYDILYEMVSGFKDAHTSTGLNNAELPARAKVAYLGFKGVRQGNALLVKELLPSFKEGSDFPVTPGTLVLEMNGQPLNELTLSQMSRYRDLGHDDANLTLNMNRLFFRVSTVNGLIQDEEVTLKLNKAGKEVMVTLPWVVKDLYRFQNEQKSALLEKKKNAGTEEASIASSFEFGFIGLNGSIEKNLSKLLAFARGTGDFQFWDSFRVLDHSIDWIIRQVASESDDTGKELTTPLAGLAKVRSYPSNAIAIPGAELIPAYVSRTEETKADGAKTGKFKSVGYVYIESFSMPPGAAAEFKSTILKFRDLGVKDLVIDLIDNGGGSLLFGMELAQALTSKKVIMPEIQFRLSDSWLDDFERQSLMADTDSEQETYRRIYQALLEDRESGLRMSRRFNIESLVSYPYPVNSDLVDHDMNIVLMVNEMCASMCDIFSGIIQDNTMGRVVGAKTMGAGGNVVMHFAAPNSQMFIQTTESLILRKDGTYVENNGIDPDVVIAVNETASGKYETVRAKAFEMLTRLPADSE